jgi:Bacterial protein of unknown function (DUF882)
MIQGDAHLPTPRRRRRWGSRRKTLDRLVFDVVAGAMAAMLVSVWTASIVVAYRDRGNGATPAVPAPVSRVVSASLTDPRAKSTAYLEDAVAGGYLNPLRGRSGKLQAVFRTPGEDLGAEEADSHFAGVVDGGGGGEVLEQDVAPAAPGIYKLAIELGKARRPIADLQLVTLVPFTEKKKERIGLYYLGSWPYESGGTPRSKAYANPSGFVEVTRQNQGTPVSEHFQLGQFLTKDQFDVWPKYVIIDENLLDKLELTVEELQKEGVRVDHVHVMSGFRTPRYNKGGGNTGGRASLSRHMYGDAADVYVDNDRNGAPDDITGDGRVDALDAERFAKAAERVEAKQPALVGGIGIYKACCGHGPFTHVDTRGYRARWRGTGSG